ncbi:hypothetical protein KM799_14915 [Clostridium tyrobutyricum]|uniref:hypothetical protein n=1 Tax=Clostridium tyrobutyricum TaxID=1519 RepID=UPI001C37F2B9|nr:hypothetical protein [Clostridium tyrobutyricum]MBV4447886.1 hypothetical protein [Clostridium tyrobutyricum]
MSKVIFADNNKRIGKVLFIVEGIKTEINILHRIFTKIFDYQYEKLDRLDRYRPYNKKDNPLSSIFVINTEESNIKYIDDASGYLDNLFTKLINDYKFPVDKAAIFYIFDRDNYSNTNENLVVDLINRLGNSRESNDEYDRQGLLLLSYPSIESFTASNYIKDSFNLEIEKGSELKQYLHEQKIMYQDINKDTTELAVLEMNKAIKSIGIESYDLDNFKDTNLNIYNYEENHYRKTKKYKLLSLLCAALLDLGLIAIEED